MQKPLFGLWEQWVGGSNPLAPTMNDKGFREQALSPLNRFKAMGRGPGRRSIILLGDELAHAAQFFRNHVDRRPSDADPHLLEKEVLVRVVYGGAYVKVDDVGFLKQHAKPFYRGIA